MAVHAGDNSNRPQGRKEVCGQTRLLTGFEQPQKSCAKWSVERIEAGFRVHRADEELKPQYCRGVGTDCARGISSNTGVTTDKHSVRSKCYNRK